MKAWADFGITFSATAAGPEVYTICPQCSPHRKKKTVKCLSVNIEKDCWICHHCDWRGALKTGVEDRSNPYAWKAKTYRTPEIKWTDLPDKVVSWFASRGITEQVLRRNKIAYEIVYMPQLEAETSAIRFPYFRNGELINVKSRDGKKNFRMESGAERIFYGMDDVDGEIAVIVEGEIDKLSMEVAGLKQCISVPDGAPSPKSKDYSSKFEFLENCEEWLSQIKTFVLAVDNDEPGKVLQEELARRLGKEKCKVVVWPEGCKDANEVLVKYDVDTLKDCLCNAIDYPVKGIFSVGDLSRHVLRLYEQGEQGGDKPGWKEVDELYTVRPGEFTVVTGIPGHGKSEWLDATMLNLTSLGWSFAIFSPENQPLARHVAKLAEKYIGKPFYGGVRYKMNQTELINAQAALHNHFQFILPPDDQITVDGILSLARTTILRKGVKGIVIDPWNEIDHSRPANLSETEYISATLSKIRRFAREFSVHIWIVAHPAKLRKEKDDSGKMVYPVPTPYDISGSAHWRNKADNAVTVYRVTGSDLVEIHVQKIRFKECGKIGMATIRYEWETGRYLDANVN